MTSYAETETPASRVLYINSDDATTTYGGKDTDFEFVLEEPIVVPNHHAILASVYSAEIPYSFYNFEIGRNTLLDYQITGAGTPANYVSVGGNPTFDYFPAAGSFRYIVPEGNYNPYTLATVLESGILNGTVPCLKIRYDATSQKFKFVCITAGIRVTMGLKSGLFSGPSGDDINEEIGFDLKNILGDPFCELFPPGPLPWNNGYTNYDPANPLPGPGIDINLGYWPIETYLFADDAADMNNSIRSLFIRTNLSSQSVLDSFIGGGFSNIFCRVPINSEPGGTIRIEPVNGDVHKLLLKTKAITSISITLTNQRNRVIDLNGLNFDISLKLDFVEVKDLKIPLTIRELRDKSLADKEILEEASLNQRSASLKEKKGKKEKKKLSK